jgi:hypothetical protein
MARHLSRHEGVDGVSRLDEGALRDDVIHCWRELSVRSLRCAQRWYGLVHRAAGAWLVGGTRTDVPPGLRAPQPC